MTLAEEHRKLARGGRVLMTRWRALPVCIAVSLTFLLLTALTLRSLNSGAEAYDRVLADLDRFGLLEADLQRDALRARVGLARSYDPLAREVDGLEAGLGRLRMEVGGGEASAPLEHLAHMVRRQEALVERFKSSNALLQNSLAHFERLSASSAREHADATYIREVRSLAAAMLHLTLDTSPETAREVRDRLDALEHSAGRSADDDPIRGLLAHGRLLDQVLPSTDAALGALEATPAGRARKELRATLVRQQSASRESARASRLVLYAGSLVLVALLVRLAADLRARADALRRRACFEHAIARISMRFVNATAQETGTEIRRALAELSDCVGADRAFFAASSPSASWHTWARGGVSFQSGWPARALALTGRDPDDVHRPYGKERRLSVAQPLPEWRCAERLSEDGAQVILGFDVVRWPFQPMREGDVWLLGMALDAILNAVRRERMVAERARLERRLQEARRMETVGALASGIAHNFNNIIGAIVGHAELADIGGSTDPDRSRSLMEIRLAGHRARELVGQILSFGARRDGPHRPVSLQGCVTEAGSLLAASLPGVDLQVGEMPAGVMVEAEPVQLQQVIFNLCANAAQAMGGGGRVELSARNHDLAGGRTLSHGRLPPGRYVSLRVCDSGCGMDEETLACIFDPFFTTRAGGNGLGLATVREIISEYEGALDVHSTPGVGSCFEVWLPRVAASDPTAAAPAAAAATGTSQALLVIDASRAQRLLSEDILAALGYEPVGFPAAAQALQACQEQPDRFDAAVIGHSNAAEAVAVAMAVRERLPQLPILVATAAIEAAAADPRFARAGLEIVRRPLISGEIATVLPRSLAMRRGRGGVALTPVMEL